MQKTFRLPETTVRILVRPTIGHLLYMSRSQTWKRDLVIWASLYLCPTNCQLLATPLLSPCFYELEREQPSVLSYHYLLAEQ